MDPSDAPEITAEMLQQNPTLMLIWTGFTLFFFTVLAGSIASWIWIGIRWWKQEEVLSPMGWTPRTWGLVDLLVCMLLLFSIQSFLYANAKNLLGIDVQSLEPGQIGTLELSAWSSAGLIATVLLTALWIVLRHQTTFAHVGLSTRRIRNHLFWGLVVGLCTLPVVYAISAAVTFGLDIKYEHPILDQMAANGSLNSYLLAAFSAVIAAPIAEELFFRVFVQGWMQSIPFSSVPAIVLGASEYSRGNEGSEYFNPASAGAASAGVPSKGSAGDSELPPEAAAVAGYPTEELPGMVPDESPYRAPAQTVTELESKIVPPIWPALVTGILFGLAHLDYGYSFIPLIVFGFVLGLLYRATQSVWPCILVHMMLNATSIITLGVTVYARQVAGN